MACGIFPRFSRSKRSARRSKPLGRQRNASDELAVAVNLGWFHLFGSLNWAWSRVGAIDRFGIDPLTSLYLGFRSLRNQMLSELTTIL